MVWILFITLWKKTKIYVYIYNQKCTLVETDWSVIWGIFDLTARTPCQRPMSFLQSSTLTSVSPERCRTTKKRHENRTEEGINRRCGGFAGRGSNLHSSCRPASGPDNGSTWISWTLPHPSLSPPYWLCTVARETLKNKSKKAKKRERERKK